MLERYVLACRTRGSINSPQKEYDLMTSDVGKHRYGRTRYGDGIRSREVRRTRWLGAAEDDLIALAQLYLPMFANDWTAPSCASNLTLNSSSSAIQRHVRMRRVVTLVLQSVKDEPLTAPPRRSRRGRIGDIVQMRPGQGFTDQAVT